MSIVRLLFCCLLLSPLVSCGAGEVLDIPRREAEERLRKGDISFILAADVSRLGELGNLRSPAPFYGGLLAESVSPSHGAALFTVALDCVSPIIQEEAARKLIPLVLENRDPALAERILRSLVKRKESIRRMPILSLEWAASFVLGRYEELARRETKESAAPWEGILRLASSLAADNAEPASPETADKLADLLFSYPAGERDRWVFGREGFSPLAGFPEDFGEAEYAALAGRLAAARSAYAEAFSHFRIALELRRDLFLRYPNLLGDLGRAFQFSAGRDEGAALFAEWDKLFQTEDMSAVPEDTRKAVRYRLHYFAGRMERQRGRSLEAVEFFKRALDFAPDAVQEDACIWYILDTSLSRSIREGSPNRDFIPLLEQYLPRWHDAAYFEDVLDRLSRTLVTGKRWKELAGVFSLFPPGLAWNAAAQYAYILGRAVEEKLLSPADAAEVLAKRGGAGENAALRFFKIARDENGGSFYYRALASGRLGMPLIPETRAGEEAEGEYPHPEEMDFFLGFFRFGAEQFAYDYLQDAIERLDPRETRALAEAFHDAGRWAEAMRAVAAYTNRPGYIMTRRDLELSYPRPFQDLVESGAAERDIPPEFLYGLIRTESAFEPEIRSRSGALGLTQLMPATAQEMAGRMSREGGPDYRSEGMVDLRSPPVNVHLGAYYLRYLLNRMESPLLAIAAYNGGMGRVRRWRAAESRLPEDLFLETIDIAETRDYGRKVLSAAAAYGYLYYKRTMEAVVSQAWERVN